MKRRQILFWIFLVGMVASDQLVKANVRANFNPGQYRTIIPGVFEITLTYNEGIAFGLFQGMGVLLAPIAIAIAAGAAWYSTKHPKESPWVHGALGLLAAGALGNLYDRVFNKRVTDMFYARFINFPVFNVADACITIASILLIFIWWGESKRTATEPTPEPALPEA